ncbi:MAG: PilW family protein [Cellvibrionaceae bacterium]
MKLTSKYISGFTLIEILVALTIGSIILAGVVQVFLGSKQAESLTMSLARIQENGRFAMEALNKDLRLTGYQGCADPQLEFIPPSNIQANNFGVSDISNQPIAGAAVPSGGGTVSLFGGAVSVTDAVGDTDIVSIIYASPKSEQLSSNMATASADITIGANNAGFAPTDVLLISNCSSDGQYVFQATTVSGSGPVTITHSAAGNSSNSFGSLLFETGTSLHELIHNTYYIKVNPRGIRALYRRSLTGNTVELIEGVENFKVLYGHYEDNNTTVITDDDIRWVDAATINSTASLDWRNVSSVKAALLMTDDLEVLSSVGPASYSLLGTSVAPINSDRKLRRVFSTSAKIRNRDGKRISQ